MRKIYLFVLLLMMYSSFGQDGALVTSYIPGNTHPKVTAMARLSNGAIIYGAGEMDEWGSVYNSSVLKLNPNGSANQNFVPFSPENGWITCIYILSNSKILVGTTYGLVRLNSNGTVDNTFIDPFSTIGVQIFDIVLQPGSNKLLIATGGTTVHKGIYRLNSNFTLDSSFNASGNGVVGGWYADSVKDIETYDTGEIIIVGKFAGYNTVLRQGFAKLNADGSLNSTTFPAFTNYSAKDATIQADGKIVVVGGNNTGTSIEQIVRFNANGTIDTSFIGPAGSATNYDHEINVIELQADGKMIIGGNFEYLDGLSRRSIARLNTDGTVDTCFDPGFALSDTATLGDGEAMDLIIEPDGKIITCGTFSYYNGTARNAIAKIYGNSVDAINDTATISSGGGTAINNILSNDISGNVGATISNVTLVQVSTTNSNIALNTSTGAVTVAAGMPQGIHTLVYKICGLNPTCQCDTATVTITIHNVVDAVDESITAEMGDITTINVLTNDTYSGSQATTANVTISVIGNFPNNGPLFDSNTGAVYITDTTPVGLYTFTYQICDTTLPSNCDTATITITVSSPPLLPGQRANHRVEFSGLQTGGMIIIAGYFSEYNYQSANKITRLRPNFGLDPGFVSTGPFPGAIMDVDIQQDDYIIVAGEIGGFNNTNTTDGIVRLTPNGSLDAAFNPGGSGPAGSPCNCQNPIVHSVAVENNGKIIAVGGFKSYNSSLRNYIVGLKSDGTIDPQFNYISGLDQPATEVAIHQNKILISGHFSRYNNIPVKKLFRIDEFGNIDSSWNQKVITFYSANYPNLGGIIGQIETIVVQPDGYILIGGFFQAYDGVPRRNIARLDPSGNLDLSFDPGTGFDGIVRAISVEPDGSIFVGGSFTTYNGQSVNTLIRLESDGDLDPTFYSGTGPEGKVWTLTRQPDNKVIVGGRFINYNNIYAGHVTRIVPSTGIQAKGVQYYESEPAIDMNPFNNLASKYLNIYPNPSTGLFTLDLSGYDNAKFELAIYNTLGQLIHEGVIYSHNNNQVDLSSFESGNYFIRLHNSKETINKIIVKK